MLDALPASSMAELGDTLHATCKLEELKTKLRDGRLHQPNHADADMLLRAWTDPTVAALVPIITANKIPREGGTFFLRIGAGPGIQEASWLSFQSNGGPSLNFSASGKRSLVDDDSRVYRNALCSNEGITRHGCSVTSKASPDGQPLPLLRIMKFQVVALPGHRSFPCGMDRLGPRSSQCKEAKLPDQMGDYSQLADPPIALVHAEPKDVPATEWHTFQKLSVEKELHARGFNIVELLEKLQRNFEDLDLRTRARISEEQQQQVPGPSGCQWSNTVESQSADLAEWFRKHDPNEDIQCGDVVFIVNGKITKTCPPDSFSVIASVVSTDPAFLGNAQLDPTERDRGLNVILIGQGPVRVQGKASEVPRASILVPSGRGDGCARAVSADEVEEHPGLLAFCLGTVLSVPTAEEDAGKPGQGYVHGFVSSKPVFGSVHNLVANAHILAERSSRPPMELKGYQAECVERAKKENIVVNLATGMGKTLVAVRVIEHFLQCSNRETTVALFLVPTRPLVKQQAACCRVQGFEVIPRVAECAGSATDQWTAPYWQQLVADNDIMVGTPEVFRKAFVDFGFLRLEQVSIMVFDEAHCATGNSPYAAIMNDAYHPSARMAGPYPRILGLTASFVGGSLKGIEQKRQDLEKLLQASLFSPDLSGVALQHKEMTQCVYTPNKLYGMQELARGKTELLLQEFTGAFNIPVHDPEKISERAQHVFLELGMACFIYYLREGVVKSLEGHAMQLKDLNRAGAQYKQRLLIERLPRLRREMQLAAERLEEDGELTRAPNVSNKCAVLIQLIKRLLQQNKDDNGYKGIVFVEQVALTFPLADLLNRTPELREFGLSVGAVSGGGSMTEAARSKTLEQFRRSELRLLVCTNALEEGLDVPECAFVVRYTQIKTTKSHIQGSGRARRDNAKVFYFDNSPEEEKEKAALLDEIARDSNLALSMEERLRRIRVDDRAVPGLYPFGVEDPSAGEVNLYNAENIFTNYCCQVLGQPINVQESLFKIDSQLVRTYPPSERTYLAEVKYPSPDGFIVVMLGHVNTHWGGVALDDVLDPQRARNWSGWDKDRSRFLFAVVVQMRTRGLSPVLTPSNQPSVHALAMTKKAVPAVHGKSGVRVRNAFDQASLSASSSQAQPHREATTTSSPTAGANYKGALNERKPIVGKYSSEQVPGTSSHEPRFVSSVALFINDKAPQPFMTFLGAAMPNRKAAEQSAAQAALEHLNHT